MGLFVKIPAFWVGPWMPISGDHPHPNPPPLREREGWGIAQVRLQPDGRAFAESGRCWLAASGASNTPPASSRVANPGPEVLENYLRNIERELPDIVSPEAWRRLWVNLKGAGFLPETDLPRAGSRLGQLLMDFLEAAERIARLGYALSIEECASLMGTLRGERRSLGKILEKEGAKLLAKRKDRRVADTAMEARLFLEAGGAEWTADDTRRLLLIWNESGIPEAEAVRGRICRFLENFQPDALDDAQRAVGLWKILSERKILAGTLGETLHLTEEEREALAPKIGLAALRLEAGENWDPTWKEPQETPPMDAAGFVTLPGERDFTFFWGKVLGKDINLEALFDEQPLRITTDIPLIIPFLLADGKNQDPLLKERIRKRFFDPRTTPLKVSPLFWDLLRELSQSSPEALYPVLKCYQRFSAGLMKTPKVHVLWTSWLRDGKLEGIEGFRQLLGDFLADGGWYLGRAGTYAVRVGRQSFERATSEDERWIVMNAPDGLRIFYGDEIAKFPWIPLGPEERRHLEGLQKLALHEASAGLLLLLEGERGRLDSPRPSWLDAYEALVAQSAKGTLDPDEALTRVLRLVLLEQPDLFQMATVPSPLFRENLPAGRERELRRHFVEGLPMDLAFSTSKFFSIKDDFSAHFVRTFLETSRGWCNQVMTAEKVLLDALFDARAGDLLKTGREGSPHDDRYTEAEFEKILDLLEWLREEFSKTLNPMNLFGSRVQAGGFPFENFEGLGLVWLFLSNRIPTDLDIPAYVRRKLRKNRLAPEDLRNPAVHRCVQEALWLNVLLYGMNEFRAFLRNPKKISKGLLALAHFFAPESEWLERTLQNRKPPRERLPLVDPRSAHAVFLRRAGVPDSAWNGIEVPASAVFNRSPSNSSNEAIQVVYLSLLLFLERLMKGDGVPQMRDF